MNILTNQRLLASPCRFLVLEGSKHRLPCFIKAKVRVGCKHQSLSYSAFKSHWVKDAWADEGQSSLMLCSGEQDVLTWFKEEDSGWGTCAEGSLGQEEVMVAQWDMVSRDGPATHSQLRLPTAQLSCLHLAPQHIQTIACPSPTC